MSENKNIEFTVNGQAVSLPPMPGEMLSTLLRERLNLTGTKIGCNEAECGACTVILDGEPVLSCTYPAVKAHGKQVSTIEGLAQASHDSTKLHPLQEAFVKHGAVQCGFCIPGIALRAKHLLDRNPGPSREEIARAIDGHLCRCTGYTQIVEAVELMARAWRGGALPEPAGDGGVGKPLARYGALGQALGERPYVADLHREGLLHGALVLSAHARARVVRIDTSKAAALPGVRAVITAADVPGERWYGLLYDDWPGFVAEGEEVRCVGDVLAAVAAGGFHSLGLKSDGTIVAWGANDYGQCDVPSPNADFVAIAAGYAHFLGLKSDGSVVAWGGLNDYGQCNVPPPNENLAVFFAFSVTIVAVMFLFRSCAITSSFVAAVISPDSIVPLVVFPDH